MTKENLLKLSLEELINEATNIIVEDEHKDSDIEELNQIRFLLSKHYFETNVLGSTKEGQYNQLRAEDTVKLQEEMAVTKATSIAKLNAENSYGTYRQVNATASGIAKLIETMGGAIIGLQVKLKNENKVPF